jgi:hypothetical protein
MTDTETPSRYVWAVRAVTTGNPDTVKEAIDSAISALRSPAVVNGLDSYERQAWREDINFVGVSTPAVAGPNVSVLVDIDLYDRGRDAAQLAAILSGGFDTAVMAAIMALPEVSEGGHSDRIERLTS